MAKQSKKSTTPRKPSTTAEAIAKELLLIEAAAITRAAQRLNDGAMNRATQLIIACQGKVIVIGMGKSGIIAQKIAATLTSTGTGAHYLHPAEALHGDLGIVANNDVAILLSNSGETDEICRLLPALKGRNVARIAIVGNVNSTLAKSSDVVLNASVDKEACPLNLAPTASTTLSLALGDAIAAALMKLRGVTREDFALNHPAGQLGKRLIVKVSDIMHSGAKNPTLAPKTRFKDILGAITNYGLGAVNIINEKGILLGIITDGDIRRILQKGDWSTLQNLVAKDLMTSKPISIRPDILAYEALKLMENRSSQIAVLPVVEANGLCVGLLRLHDIIGSGI